MIDTGNPRLKWLGERLRAATCELPPLEQLVTTPYFALSDVTLVINATPASEPSSLVLLGIGVTSLVAYAWRRRDYRAPYRYWNEGS
jgi:hypothetical protein